MKNFIKHLTGIVFLLIISIACCNQKKSPQGVSIMTPTPSDIRIELNNVVEINGVKHLFMSDSINKNVIDSAIITDVYLKKKVKWKKGKDSGIETIIGIESSCEKNNIFKNKPKLVSNSIDEFEMDIPDTAIKGVTDKYLIKFKLKNDPNTYVSDPYLRIPED